jgi:hypothetical protein
VEKDRDAGRLYDDREIGMLIKRATELQESASERKGGGLPLHEIERIAAEIGISPAHLREAALDLDHSGAPAKGLRLLGGPFEVGSRRVITGSVSDEHWERIVSELRRVTGSAGTVGAVGRRREWTRTVSDMGQVLESTEVVVSPRGEATAVEVRSRFAGGARMAYIVSLLLGGGTAGIFLDGAGFTDLVNTLILTGGGAAGLGAARISIGYWARRRRESLGKIADWLQRQIAPDAGSPAHAAAGRMGEDQPVEAKWGFAGTEST